MIRGVIFDFDGVIVDVIITSDDIGGDGKPSPKMYSHIFLKMGLESQDCCSVEDSQAGVLSSKTAGLYCIGFLNGHNHPQDLVGANSIVDDLREVINHLKG